MVKNRLNKTSVPSIALTVICMFCTAMTWGSEDQLAADIHALEQSFMIPADPSKDIQALVAEFAKASHSFEEAEKGYAKLLEDYVRPDERGRICLARLNSYLSYGPRTPEITIDYATQALSYPLEPIPAMSVYGILGKAIWRKIETAGDEPLTTARREAAIAYLKGIRISVDLDTPYGPLPELQMPTGLKGSGSLYEKARIENDKRMEAWKERKAVEEIIKGRSELERSVLYLYGLKPRDNPELRSLCKKYLVDEVAVEKTMEMLMIVIGELECKLVPDESILYPYMPKEFRAKARFRPESVLLENAVETF